MILNAKTRFLEQKPFAAAHRELVTSESFQRACEAALTEMVLNKPAAKTHEEAVAFNYAIEGATTFLKLLLNIAEIPAKPPERPSSNLNHQLR